ncbi:hypothetical protein [Streptomyces leeuwenhoekii]|uniref:Sle1_110 protein n=1 Tax=Streptomyces leeuwenhoekii TaxID=1437453 RepID=A0A0F7VPI8_STRLW|nr:hypothetical protein [Streptomyces leeuwenhoekii]CQR59277.1 sle1_110 [Streptomyces leeuwenhoekii]
MTGIEFREAHGDPANWDDDEYEAYFAITADQTPTPDSHHLAA